jgi:hypothetical protein
MGAPLMLHKEFFGLVFLAFVAWIFLAAAPAKRIERGCAPIAWVGNATTSLSSLVVPSQQAKVQGWFNKLGYGCQYVTWRLIYQDSYNEWLASQGLSPEGKPGADGAAVPAQKPASAAAPSAPSPTPSAFPAAPEKK